MPELPQVGTQTRALYDYLITGKVYSHSMSQTLGIAGTASPKRLQEAKPFLTKNGYSVLETKARSSRNKPYVEYRAVKMVRDQQDLFKPKAA